MPSHATPTTPAPTPTRILRPRAVADTLGVSLTTVWRLRRRGDLPEPIRLSPGCVGWPETTIRDWLVARAEAGR